VDNTLVLAQRSMTQNLAYVAMTRHKKSAQMYYGEKSFPRKLFTGGIIEALSRPAAKSTTLDYEGSIDYQAALGFGQRRGFNPSNTIMDQMKAFTQRQFTRLTKLGERLLKAAPKLETSADWLLPAMPMPMPKEEWIEAALMSDERIVEAESKLRNQVNLIFKQNTAVFEKLRSVALNPSLDSQAIEALSSHNIAQYGELKGDTWWERTSKKKVETLNKDLSYTARLVGRLAKARLKSAKSAASDYVRLEKKLAIAIPALTDTEQTDLFSLVEKVQTADEKNVRIFLDKDHAELLEKAKAIEDASSRRFDISGVPKFMSNHIPRPDDGVRQTLLDNHFDVLKAAWKLVSAEAGWKMNLDHRSNFDRGDGLDLGAGPRR